MNKHTLSQTMLVSAALLSPAAAHAAVVVTALEVGNDVVFTGGGTLNIDGLNSDGVFTPDPANITLTSVYGPQFALGGPQAEVDVYGIGEITPPADFGTSNFTGTGTGDHFGVASLVPAPMGLVVPLGYTSNAPLSGELTFANEDFASLGLIPGTYVWSWGTGQNADTVTLDIVVPEPASLAMVAIGGLLLWRRD